MSATRSTTALVVVDVQRDFLARPGLSPSADVLVTRVAALLAEFRARGAAVVHVQTRTRADGTDAMPHWRDRGIAACVEGTPGAESPVGVAPEAGELVATKQHYRGFADSSVVPALRGRGVTRVVVCGLYTHACVRETVLDAYEAGFEVWVASDAIATPEPLHGILTREWLEPRAARFANSAVLVGVLDGRDGVAERIEHRDPCDTSTVLAEVPVAGPAEVHAAARSASRAQSDWATRSLGERAGVLDTWAEVLGERADDFVELICREVAKPRAAAADEVRRAIGHVRASAALARSDVAARQVLAPQVAVTHHPVGVIGIVMPWNNPLALPAGKIAPALAFGNGVVCKPAPEGTATARALLDSLEAAGVPAGLVGLVTGAAGTAETLVDDPLVAAVAVTGSIATGRAVAARTGRHGKPLQAELGGNNAAVVLADADLDAVVAPLIAGAYSYAGQRCTAIRRFVVDDAIADEFEARARSEIEALVVGEPSDPTVTVGPLISVTARDRVARVVDEAVVAGARVVCGGRVPEQFERGAWYAPTLLADVAPQHAVAQQETFGPVTVLLRVRGIDEAIRVANDVEQGLVASVCTSDPAARRRLVDELAAGIVHVGPGPVPVHADAPFGGWKASGIGLPEHGVWDAAFATKPQAVYGDDPA